MQIAKYFATFGIKIDQKSVDKINAILKKLETAAKTYHKKINTLEDKGTTNKLKGINKVSKAQKDQYTSHLKLYEKHQKGLIKAEEKALKQKGKLYSAGSLHNSHTQAYQNRIANQRNQTQAVRRTSGLNSSWLPYQSAGSGMSRYYSNMENQLAHRNGLRENRDFNNNKKDQQRARVRNIRNVGRAARIGRNAGLVAGIPALSGLYLAAAKTEDAYAAYAPTEGAFLNLGMSKGQAQNRYKEFKSFANDYGMRAQDQAMPFGRVMSALMSAGIKDEDAMGSYKTWARFFAANQTGSEQQKYALTGYQQSLSIGELSMQEARQQIFEHVPTARLAYSRAIKDYFKSTTGEDISENDAISRIGDPKYPIDTIKLNKFLMKQLEALSTAADLMKNLSPIAAKNRFFNTFDNAFDPTTDPAKAETLRLFWGAADRLAKSSLPMLEKIFTALADNLTQITDKVATLLGVDLYANEKRDLAAKEALNYVAAGGNIEAPSKLQRSRRTIANAAANYNTPALLKWAITGEKLNYDWSPSVGSYDALWSQEENKYMMQDHVRAQFSTPEGQRKYLNDPVTQATIRANVERLIKDARTPQSTGKGMLLNTPQNGGGSNKTTSINIDKLEVTTRDASTFPQELFKAVAQHRGVEAVS